MQRWRRFRISGTHERSLFSGDPQSALVELAQSCRHHAWHNAQRAAYCTACIPNALRMTEFGPEQSDDVTTVIMGRTVERRPGTAVLVAFCS